VKEVETGVWIGQNQRLKAMDRMARLNFEADGPVAPAVSVSLLPS
jgi:hypothetical protein